MAVVSGATKRALSGAADLSGPSRGCCVPPVSITRPTGRLRHSPAAGVLGLLTAAAWRWCSDVGPGRGCWVPELSLVLSQRTVSYNPFRNLSHFILEQALPCSRGDPAYKAIKYGNPSRFSVHLLQLSALWSPGEETLPQNT